jgi:hypothetical protein
LLVPGERLIETARPTRIRVFVFEHGDAGRRPDCDDAALGDGERIDTAVGQLAVDL